MRGKVTCLWQHFASKESRKNADGFQWEISLVLACRTNSSHIYFDNLSVPISCLALGNGLRDYGLARRFIIYFTKMEAI